MKSTPYILLFLLVACTTSRVTSNKPGSLSIQGKMYAAFFHQQAAEYRALCYQAFNIATLRVNQWQKKSTRPTAIVTDLDETVLDNSAYAVHQTLLGTDHTAQAWEQWTSMAKADTIPGGLTFLKYAASKGIEIFYITNRLENERAGTLKNLQRYNFPNADNAHLLLKDVSSKEMRRNKVLATHDILLLLGDNLADFSSLFDKQLPAARMNNTDNVGAEFGKRFIVLPNTTYGDWESAVFKYNYNLSLAERDSIIRQSLKSY
ncbi:MAG: acid phosphatase [Segetibacter sp.]|nr:acid phosphatase [Segetibacter sp.]